MHGTLVKCMEDVVKVQQSTEFPDKQNVLDKSVY